MQILKNRLKLVKNLHRVDKIEQYVIITKNEKRGKVKDFYDVYNSTLNEKEELPTLFCDMDMVLVDFLKGADKEVGQSFVKMDNAKRWATIHKNKTFWENLDWMPGAKRLWSFVNKYGSHILSAYSTKDSNCVPGKMKWLRKNLKLTQRSRIHLVRRSQKQDFAMTNNKPNVLIDDHAKNIKEWKSKGGIGIHHLSVSTTLNELKKLGYKQL